MTSAGQKWLRTQSMMKAKINRLFTVKWLATFAAAVTRTGSWEKRCQRYETWKRSSNILVSHEVSHLRSINPSTSLPPITAYEYKDRSKEIEHPSNRDRLTRILRSQQHSAKRQWDVTRPVPKWYVHQGHPTACSPNSSDRPPPPAAMTARPELGVYSGHVWYETHA